MHAMLDYFFHKFDPNNFHLTMSILIKDEVDVIEKNIRTHAKMGVDSFVIMDNNSQDGTKELLEKLKSEFEMIILHENGIFNQKKWMTRLAFEAKRKYKSDWIINSDSDEFWIPNDGNSLKKSLMFKGGMLWIERSNMLPPLESKNNPNIWHCSELEVRNQILFRDGGYVSEASIILGKIGRKVIVNPHGLYQINSGNHSAEHIAIWKKHQSDKIRVYHYPIRSFEQFYKRVKTRKEVLDKDSSVKLGNHERRWKKMFEDGTLEEEYEKFLYNNEETKTLEKAGIVVHNILPSKILTSYSDGSIIF